MNPPSPTELNLELLIQTIQPLIQSIVYAILAIVVPYLAAKAANILHANWTDSQIARVTKAAQDEAGAIIAAGDAHIANEKVPVGDSRVLNAANNVIAALPKVIASAGITPDRVQSMVAGEIGRLQLQSNAPAASGAVNISGGPTTIVEAAKPVTQPSP